MIIINSLHDITIFINFYYHSNVDITIKPSTTPTVVTPADTTIRPSTTPTVATPADTTIKPSTTPTVATPIDTTIKPSTTPTVTTPPDTTIKPSTQQSNHQLHQLLLHLVNEYYKLIHVVYMLILGSCLALSQLYWML